MRNVRMSDTKTNNTPKKMMVVSMIIERHNISGAQVNTKLHRCSNSVGTSEIGTRKDILNVLLLGEVDAIGHIRISK